MRTLLILPLVLSCSSGTPGNDAGVDAGMEAAADAPTDTQTGDVVCNPPQGSTCPTTAGNCKGIGDPCTQGGGQCPSGTACDKDLDGDAGAGICITILSCTPGKHQCGTGASCCNTPMTSNVSVCLPNQCLPSDCTAE